MMSRTLFAGLAGCLSCLAAAQGAGEVARAQAEAIQSLRDRVPLVRLYSEGARVDRVYGVPFGNGFSPQASAQGFVDSYAPIFAPGAGSFIYEGTADLMKGKFTAVYYREVVSGRTVLDAGLMLLVRNEPGYPLVLASSRSQTVDPIPSRPAISETEAVTRALAENPILELASLPVLRAYPGEETRLAWVFELSTHDVRVPMRYEVVVDAMNGAVLEWRDRVYHVDVSGTTKGWGSAGSKPDNAVNPPQLLNLRGQRVSIAGGTFAYAGLDGAFTISNAGSTAVNVTADMRGRWVNVINSGSTAMTQTISVTPPGPANFVFNSPSSEFQTAQVNALINTERVHDFADGINPNYPGIDIQVPATVNIVDSCNAYYTNNTINFYRAGGGCPNMAYSTVVWHEYGHFIIAKGHPSPTGDYHEGIADTTANLLGDSPCTGEDFFGPNTGCLRNAVNNFMYPCSGGSHDCGNVISGAFWGTLLQLNNTVGHTTGLELVRSWYLNSILLHPNGITPAITIDVLTLDDDDNDIYNGTPHYTEIAAGFGAKNLDAPQIDWLTFQPISVPPDIFSYAVPSLRPRVTMNVSSNAGVLDPTTVRLHYKVNMGAWQEVPMFRLGQGQPFSAAFPYAPSGSAVQWYVSARDTQNRLTTYPREGQAGPRMVVFVTDIQTALTDTFETDMGWTVQNQSLTTGAWVRLNPNGSSLNGQPANPENDSNDAGLLCYFTGQGPVGGGAGDADVDGGPTYLTSPTLDLSGANAIIEFRRWFYNDDGDDRFIVEVSNNNGATWVQVESHVFSAGMNAWNQRSFVVGNFVAPTGQVKVRFSTSDNPNDSVTEAAVDNVVVRLFN